MKSRRMRAAEATLDLTYVGFMGLMVVGAVTKLIEVL